MADYSKRVKSITAPPIDIITTKVMDMRDMGRKAINLGQAVCNLPLPSKLIPELKESLSETIINSYTPDPGLMELREAVASKYFDNFFIKLSPEDEIIITAGANQAFMEVLAVISDPGDEIIICSPYYFDHEFAIKASGCTPVISPMRERNYGFSLDIKDIESKITPKTKAVVIVTPNNPTGAVIKFTDLMDLNKIIEKNNLYLISDETYDKFVFSPDVPSTARKLTLEENVIVISSLSKTSGLAGMRIGYIITPASLYGELIKIQDAMIVCAPHIAQKAALICLKEKESWFAKRLKAIEERKNITNEYLSKIKVFETRPVEGAFFAFPKYKIDVPSLDLALDILDKTGVALIHGSAFGEAGEGHLRISFGNTDIPVLKEALERIANYFNKY
ncbi:MAG: pyridoxal phosphate-dependent aminotransferase [Armatimonadota bacterium]